MSRTSTTDDGLIEDSSEIRRLTQAINRLTCFLVILNLILILLTLPIAIDAILGLGW